MHSACITIISQLGLVNCVLTVEQQHSLQSLKTASRPSFSFTHPLISLPLSLSLSPPTNYLSLSQASLRSFAATIFRHLHQLDSSFHLNNPSGLLSVAYVRGVRGFQTILFQVRVTLDTFLLNVLYLKNLEHEN